MKTESSGEKAKENDWIVFSVGRDGRSVLVEYGGPPVDKDTEACAIDLELEGLTTSEIIDTIEFKDIAFPEIPGLYRWEGTFSWWESRDWETGQVDDWHLVANGGTLTKLYPVEKP
jgi:hypothetical protein